MRLSHGQKWSVLVFWNAGCEGLDQIEDARARREKPNQTSDNRDTKHAAKENPEGTEEVGTTQLRSLSCASGHRKANAKRQPHPPSRDNAPEQSKHRWRIGSDQSRVPNRKILHAYSCSNLIVDDPVEYSGHYGRDDDADDLHTGVCLGERSRSVTRRH
jgi:hypothetical protein